MASEDMILVHITCSCGKHSVLRVIPERLYSEPKPRTNTIPSSGESTSRVTLRLVRAEEKV